MLQNDDSLTQNLLDHNLVGVPYIANEDAVTMDEMFWGTEAEIERMYAADLTMHCKLSDIFFVAHEKRWLQDGKGLLACKLVSVIFTFI